MLFRWLCETNIRNGSGTLCLPMIGLNINFVNDRQLSRSICRFSSNMDYKGVQGTQEAFALKSSLPGMKSAFCDFPEYSNALYAVKAEGHNERCISILKFQKSLRYLCSGVQYVHFVKLRNS
ncbi:hypothetical protein MKW98_023981 [Papaver atlanticum]|uniref:Uncharacterized protein n=1 Tax=Papaver atlanticum TaxID=357466 RepID=A0AAD4T127_9MAGN|nr:hypothetical protein MKW98_023981 [Papaver atlanticum]